MTNETNGAEAVFGDSFRRHLAYAPVAFAVTEGPAHTIVYSNTAFRRLQSAGEISVERPPGTGPPPAACDLSPVLRRVLRDGTAVRDERVAPAGGGLPAWSCTVWPVPDRGGRPERLVVEVRDVGQVEQALVRQREIAERLLLGALREQDLAHDLRGASERAVFLADASRRLAASLDEAATRDTLTHLALPQIGAWCIVDVIEANGAMYRLAVVHPDPAKQALARALGDQWAPEPDDAIGVPAALRSAKATIIADDAEAVLVAAAHGSDNLRILRELGFGSLLVVPLITRATVRGAITFVSRAGDPVFTADDVALAEDLCARCAMALDSARLYREAGNLRAAAEQASLAKSEFLGNMSHELRTPLNAIGGYTELIEMGLRGPVTPEQLKDLARIKYNQQHLLGLITEILNFVRVGSGRMEYHISDVDMRTALRDSIGMLEGLVAAKGLTVDGPHCDAAVMARTDPEKLRQIVINLISNSVKYTPTGGRITVDCDVTADTVLAHVSDTGIGVPVEKLDSIFEPFVQLQSGYASREGGVGLGLAISRDLARAMSGDLTVDSKPGAGSRFTLTLPRAPAAALSKTA